MREVRAAHGSGFSPVRALLAVASLLCVTALIVRRQPSTTSVALVRRTGGSNKAVQPATGTGGVDTGSGGEAPAAAAGSAGLDGAPRDSATPRIPVADQEAPGPSPDAPAAAETNRSKARPHKVMVTLASRVINRTIAPSVAAYRHEAGLGRVVVGVLSDGVLQTRLRAALSTWLQTAFHVFVFFTDVEASRRVKAELEDAQQQQEAPPAGGRNANASRAAAVARDRVTIVLLPLPAERGPFSVWKNFAIVEYWNRPETLKRLFVDLLRGEGADGRRNETEDTTSNTQKQTTQKRHPPLFFCIADDDSYILGPAMAYHLAGHTAALDRAFPLRRVGTTIDDFRPTALGGGGSLLLADAAVAPRVYTGHIVQHCSKCRHPGKKFYFIYGGNGIFLSLDALLLLQPHMASCVKTLRLLPGDTQVGGCIHKHRIATAVDILVGVELPTSAFGSYPQFTAQAPFPWAFHRVKDPVLAQHIYALERRYPGQILVWDWIGRYFLEELGWRYQQKKWLFPKMNI